MPEGIACDVLNQPLADHPAVQAWSRLGPGRREPRALELLKLKPKSATYRLKGAGPNGSAVIAKRCLSITARIERLIYEECLATFALPALRLFGFVEEPGTEFSWLFLEDARAQQYSRENTEHRILAAHWLAAVQRSAGGEILANRLPGRGPQYYLELLRTARAIATRHLGNRLIPDEELTALRSLASQCDVVESRWSEMERLCERIPPTLVHGDLVVKNVSVRPIVDGLMLLVFDWETAGWGVPGVDICHLSAGALAPDLGAYCDSLQARGQRVHVRELQKLAMYGSIFRILDEISWEGPTMTKFDSYTYLSKPIASLRIYGWRMADALKTLEWS